MAVLAELLSSPDSHMRDAAALAAKAFETPGTAEAMPVYVPGRVEFLGKHTDYAGGRSLLLAADRGFRMVAVPRDDGVLRLATGDGTDRQEFPFGRTPDHEPGHWVNYAATVARRVRLNFADEADLRGADMAFVSDLPMAAGMSSSSALMVATFLSISAVNRLERTDAFRREIDSRLKLAEYLGCVENGQSFGSLTGEAGVGTFGGSEDHTAMLCCGPDRLSMFSFAPAVFERELPFPAGHRLVVASSGVVAIKTAAAKEQYNRASIRARQATAAYNRAAGADCRHLRDVVEHVGTGGLEKATEAIDRGASEEDCGLDLPTRFEQFYREDQQIIPEVADALAAGALDRNGPLVDASHAGADVGLNNQVPQTNFLRSSARQLGALAASAFGAGFGGSVWAMVEAGSAEGFIERWSEAYAADFFEPGMPAPWSE